LKTINYIITISLCLFCISAFSSFITSGCARGPFPTPELPTATPLPITPTSTGPTSTPAGPQNVLEITFKMNGTIDKYHGYYIFAFNRPSIVETEADPISTNSEFWTDFVSFGPVPPQLSDYIRRQRLVDGDITSDWNKTVFTFTAGTVSNQQIQILMPLSTLGNPKSLYFNFITADANSVPRDALGINLGSTTDSVLVNLTDLNKTTTVSDIIGDYVTNPAPPTDFNPPSYDIVSGTIILKQI